MQVSSLKLFVTRGLSAGFSYQKLAPGSPGAGVCMRTAADQSPIVEMLFMNRAQLRLPVVWPIAVTVKPDLFCS